MAQDGEQEKRASPGPLGKPGGLYDGVRLTRKGANVLAVVSLALLTALFVLVIALGRGGILVQFDPNGGTDVPAARVEYGQPLPEQDPPAREGYVFTGWYRDPACYEPWADTDTVTEAVTLYAGWEAKE